MARTSPRVAADDTGFTLVEVVVSIVIFGLTATALLGAILTMLTSSSSHREQSNANSVLASAAESIADPSRNAYQPLCPAPSPAYLPALGVTTPSAAWTIDAAIIAWDGGAACIPSVALHTITVTVTAPSGTIYRLEVVKRP